jgi:hypothetical protein
MQRDDARHTNFELDFDAQVIEDFDEQFWVV